MTLAANFLSLSRSVGRYEFPVEDGKAFAEAAQNYHANLAALESIWCRTTLCVPETMPELEWLYARDGALSARHVDGQWLSSVSIPRRSADRMLGKAQVSGSSAVLIAPTHAQQIRVVLDRLTAQQVLIVIIGGEYMAGTILACADFSGDIRSKRLWLACGPDWPEELNAILEGNEGIAPPSMMIRVPGLNAENVDAILKPCEAILAQHSQNHRTQLNLLHSKPRFPRRPPAKVCVVTGGFSLWDDASHLLGQLVSNCSAKIVAVDASRGTNNSSLHLARVADGCDAIVTANISRSDLPQIVPENIPWLTWATQSRLPRAIPSATLDRLIIADASQLDAALAAGWDRSAISVGQEPPRVSSLSRNPLPTIIADLPAINLPRSVEEMSSQRLVWEQIEAEITRNPFCLGKDPIGFVYAVAQQIGLGRAGFPIDTFHTGLVVPCFMRSLALALHGQGVRFAIYGSGWDVLPELSTHWKGPIRNQPELANALALANPLIDVWPGEAVHPARRAGRPLLRPLGRDLSWLLREIKTAALKSAPPATAPVLDLDQVLQSL